MKKQTWIIKADGVAVCEVKTSISADKKIAISKACIRLPQTALFHKLTAVKTEGK